MRNSETRPTVPGRGREARGSFNREERQPLDPGQSPERDDTQLAGDAAGAQDAPLASSARLTSPGSGLVTARRKKRPRKTICKRKLPISLGPKGDAAAPRPLNTPPSASHGMQRLAATPSLRRTSPKIETLPTRHHLEKGSDRRSDDQPPSEFDSHGSRQLTSCKHRSVFRGPKQSRLLTSSSDQSAPPRGCLCSSAGENRQRPPSADYTFDAEPARICSQNTNLESSMSKTSDAPCVDPAPSFDDRPKPRVPTLEYENPTSDGTFVLAVLAASLMVFAFVFYASDIWMKGRMGGDHLTIAAPTTDTDFADVSSNLRTTPAAGSAKRRVKPLAGAATAAYNIQGANSVSNVPSLVQSNNSPPNDVAPVKPFQLYFLICLSMPNRYSPPK
ncbi:hypothetical protein HPB48_014052 [Haemaphysalis longicornis]|uniref:Transmembrane protein n=1 Tax=Haemaphysalis longicornis TaxID=44386 RepID=A0A9J6FY81_HAELO|nr:hypothetical protein HPB48_014052 [Haemaphysalis longicornis]